MVRLRNASTGVVVRVDDATATRLGAGWQSADAPATSPAGDGGGPARPKGNASRVAWASYAETVGVAVGESWTRNEIKAAVTAATA